MQIQNINQATPYSSGSDYETQPVPLSEKMAQAQGVNAASSNTEVDAPYVEDLYQYLLSNKLGMLEDPTLSSTLIRKIKELKNEDGTATYKTYSDMAALTTLLKDKLEADGYEVSDFFMTVNSKIFGLGLFMQDLTNQIFFPRETDGTEKSLFG